MTWVAAALLATAALTAGARADSDAGSCTSLERPGSLQDETSALQVSTEMLQRSAVQPDLAPEKHEEQEGPKEHQADPKRGLDAWKQVAHELANSQTQEEKIQKWAPGRPSAQKLAAVQPQEASKKARSQVPSRPGLKSLSLEQVERLQAKGAAKAAAASLQTKDAKKMPAGAAELQTEAAAKSSTAELAAYMRRKQEADVMQMAAEGLVIPGPIASWARGSAMAQHTSSKDQGHRPSLVQDAAEQRSGTQFGISDIITLCAIAVFVVFALVLYHNNFNMDRTIEDMRSDPSQAFQVAKAEAQTLYDQRQSSAAPNPFETNFDSASPRHSHKHHSHKTCC